MDYFKFKFNEDTWTIYLIDDDDNVIADEDVAAEVKFDSKEIYFRRAEITRKIILHELWHVYFGYCYLSDTNDVTLDDMEEVSATLFADKALKLIRLSKEIKKKLLELKNKTNDATKV